MIRKAITGMMTILLMTSILTVAFNVLPILAETSTTELPDDHSTIQEADGNHLMDPVAHEDNSWYNGSKDQGYNRDALTKDNFRSSSAPWGKWDFYDTNEWNDFTYGDEDSVELVIGINNAQPNSYIELVDLVTTNGGEIVNTVSMGGEIKAAVADIPLEAVSNFVAEVKAAGLSRYVEPNMKFQATFVPNDPYWPLQWGPAKIEADWAWNTTIGDPSVLVAVIDTGIDWDHPDLVANYVALGYDWVNNDADPMDDNGHGTHCAGIIAAEINNSIGIAGLAQVRIMAEKGLDAGGSGWEDDLADAIIHAVDQGADILSNSWGGYGASALIYDAVKYAYNQGVLVVAAAGNEATSAELYPAAYDEVVAVTATDQYDDPAWFTNFGEWVEVAAPGVDIYSTIWDNSYDYMSGTSMSTPHVAGVAALIWSQFPGMSRDWVRAQLRYTADDLGDPGFDFYYGYGRINARKAVEQTPPDHDLLIWDWEIPLILEPGDLAIVSSNVLNFGTNNETNITVELLANGTIVNSTGISFLASGASVTVNCSWTPTVEGIYNVTSYVVPVTGETVTENNALSAYINVQVLPDILVVADDDGGAFISGTSLPEFESALGALGYDYFVWNESSFGNPSLSFLTKFKLVIWTVGDYWAWAVDFTDAATLESYLAAGGNILLEGEDIGYDHGSDDFMVNVAHAIYQVDDTGAPGLTVTDPTHMVTSALPTTFNWLIDPTYDDGVTPTSGGAEVIQYTGTTWTAVTVFDGGVISGSVVYYAFPLYCLAPSERETLAINSINWLLGVKYEHELAVALDAPVFLQPGNSSLLNATVYNIGLNNETNVELQLLINGSVVNSTTIAEFVNGTSYTIDYLWTPTVEATYNVTAYAPPVPDENVTTNNMVSASVLVCYARFVLWDDVHDGDGDSLTGNYLLLYQLLVQNGFVVDELTSGTINSGLLAHYDILVVIDPEYDFLSSEITDIHNWVVAGGALFVIVDTGYPPTLDTLMEPYGVQMTGITSGSGTTTNIVSHPITENVASIFYDLAWEIAVTSPSQTLAWTLENYALLSSTDGEVVVIGDSNIMDNTRLGMADNTQLMLNIFNWIGVKYEHELTVALEVPAYLEPGDSSLLNATVYNRGLSSETDVELFLLINGTIFNNVTISVLVNGTSYTIDYLWTPTVEAMYNITAYAPPVPNENVTTNNVMSVFLNVQYLEVALFKNVDPWGYPANEEALSLYGIAYAVFRSSDFGLVDLSSFTKVVIASDQDQSFYDAMDAYRWWFEDYASGGGILEIHAADWGWNGGGWVGTLPGGLQWVSYYADYVTIVDPTHPVVTTPNPITDIELDGWSASVHGYFGTYPVDARIVISEDSTGYPAYLEFYYGAGVIVASSQTLEWAYWHWYSLILENSLLYTPVKYQHELAVTLEAPASLEPGDSSLLNATVYNLGLNNETADLFLLINSSVVNSTMIVELVNGTSYTINYLWTPTVEATYNVTAYAPPVSGENVTANNAVIKMVRVRYPPRLLVVDTPLPEDTGALDMLGYEYTLVTPTEFATVDLYQYNVMFVGWEPGDTLVDALLARASEIADWVAAGNGIVALAEFDEVNRWAWLPLWVSGSTGFHEDTVHILDPTHPVMSCLTDAELSGWGNSYHGYFIGYDPAWEALAEGVEAGEPITLAAMYGAGRIAITDQDPDYHFYYGYEVGAEKLLRNMIEWATFYMQYEHELTVSLDAPTRLNPGDSSLLNATVYNRGLNNETNVELQLLINGTVVDSTVISFLQVASSYTLSYLWTPTVEGTYNVTSYAPPVPDENVTANNILSKMVYVRYVEIALISDTSELLAITGILDFMGIGYDIYNDNSFYFYTEDLSLLLGYPTVIFYHYNRLLTSDEHSALQSYISSGGNLLVTGYDSLGSPDDPLLADVIRSSTYGDNVGEPDLYVVDATHPIMDGPYGSFPAGYHISGLYSDCDMAEADTPRGALTVAELADGYDKILATEGLPGKVVYWNGIGTDDWTWNVDCEAMFKNMIVWFTIDTTPPVADAGPDQTVDEDTLVTFDGSGSWDNVGIVNYTWTFVDITLQTLTGISPNYTFATPGVYVVTLNVTDKAGYWDTDTVIITVLDVTPPFIGIPSHDPLEPDKWVNVTVSVPVTDEGIGLKNVTLSYTINNGTSWTDLPMNLNTTTGLYEATIPGQTYCTWVKYKIIAYDNAGNKATKDKAGQLYVYHVIPEFPTWTSILLILIVLTVAIAVYKRKLTKAPIH